VPGRNRKRLRVVLDSNVSISAILFGGKPKQILDLVIRGEMILIASAAILDEVEAVLGREKFRFSRAAARAVINEIEALAEIVKPTTSVSAVPEDPDDDRVIACAVDGRADRLVTGDRHLLKIGAYGGVAIVNPDDFLEALGK
jgi:putative PIN family toxin of toxin-antitoxin system